MFRKVKNKGRYKTAKGYYWHIKDKDIDYLFTDSALSEAKNRATKNPEDIPPSLEPESDRLVVGLVTGLISGTLLTASVFYLHHVFNL